MRSPVGAIVARPWFDLLALRFLARRFCPLSRAWAAAMAAQGSVERFLAEAPIDDPPPAVRDRLAAVLTGFERLRRSAGAAERRWRDAAFGCHPLEGAELAEVETARHAKAHALMAARARFAMLPRRRLVAPVRYAIPGPVEVEARYGGLLAAPERAYAAPAPAPEVAESARCAGPGGIRYWIRFASPSATMADTVTARIAEPAGVADPPTLIFGHGLWVEGEQWSAIPDPVRALCRWGVRVIQMESPWHGRRTPAGEYGGERFFATVPMGAIELLTAQAREVAVLTAWARRSSAGPVAVGGISLGALVAQLVGVHARHWPSEMRPDALLLVTTCDRLDEVALTGSLGRAFGLDRALFERGWSADALARLRPLTDPVGAPAVAPEDVVVVLGRTDSVTPYRLGRALFDRWGVPRANLFERRQGHFSAALGLLREDSHLRRLHGILARKADRERPGAVARRT